MPGINAAFIVVTMNLVAVAMLFHPRQLPVMMPAAATLLAQQIKKTESNQGATNDQRKHPIKPAFNLKT